MEALRGLSGGRKQLWLKKNRELVLGFLNENGPVATKQHFRMSDDTWESFLVAEQPRLDNLSKADRALMIAESAIDMARESQRKVIRLESKLHTLTPVIRVLYGLSAILKMAESLPALPNDFWDESGK